ncbi:MAG: hypothetical protein AB7U63_12915 [Porticoccaceae bacterium]|nr:hypothetical protein [Porticoccaceae bacterium]
MRLSLALSLALLCGVMVSPGAAIAADRYTCKMIEKLLAATDKGLADTAAGKADRQPASGIATYAREARSMADKSSTRDPLPDAVAAALSAMADAAASHYFIAAAGPLLLEQGLIIQKHMPQICPQAEVPDLERHVN